MLCLKNDNDRSAPPPIDATQCTPDLRGLPADIRIAASIVIVSDIRLLRDALENSLTGEGIVVLATCHFSSAAATLRDLSPDAVVLDGTASSAMEAARNFKDLIPDLTIIAILPTQNEVDFLAWAEIGVGGYVDQNSSATDLASNIERAVRGEVHFSPRLTAVLASRFARLSAERRSSSPLDALTPREKKVLELLAEGLPNKRIAVALGISDTTTKNHVHNILAKLGLQSRAQAAVLYSRVQDGAIVRSNGRPSQLPVVGREAKSVTVE